VAVLRYPETNQTITGESEIRAALAAAGIDYEHWSLDRVPADCSADEVLRAYAAEIEEMKRRGGYVTADVIDVTPETPNLDAMLARFDKEHTHSEDEVRFILAGRGIFFLALDEGVGKGVAAVEVHPGDMLRVPRGTRHWFTLCEDKRIRAIRWFQDMTGWTPHYTGSGVDRDYQPLCFGPAYLGSTYLGSPYTGPRIENGTAAPDPNA
jgi:1,2-dihydroxy-3-keto-5-methylthiopentene dioxygenase